MLIFHLPVSALSNTSETMMILANCVVLV